MISFCEEKLIGYKCNNVEDTYSCNNSCKKDNHLADFKVNVKKNLVLKTVFRTSKPNTPMMEPYYLDNCKILDKKNWKCKNSWKGITQEIVSYKGVISSIFTASGVSNYECYK